MPKRVLDVGNCVPDHASIRSLIERKFDATVERAHVWQDAAEWLRREKFDLVLVNRKLDRDYTDGLEIIKQIKADPDLAATPVMLLTNYPEYQQQAVAIGAVEGFGKLEYSKPETTEKLQKFLA